MHSERSYCSFVFALSRPLKQRQNITEASFLPYLKILLKEKEFEYEPLAGKLLQQKV